LYCFRLCDAEQDGGNEQYEQATFEPRKHIKKWQFEVVGDIPQRANSCHD
jgi:hypothetical protein